jgi:hypothetical protein
MEPLKPWFAKIEGAGDIAALQPGESRCRFTDVPIFESGWFRE